MKSEYVDRLLSKYSEIIKELLREKDLDRRMAGFAVITNDTLSKLCEALGFEYEGRYDHDKKELTIKFINRQNFSCNKNL